MIDEAIENNKGSEFFTSERLRRLYYECLRHNPGLIVAGYCEGEDDARRLYLEIDTGNRYTRQVCLQLTRCDGESQLNATTDAGSLPSDEAVQLTLTLMGYTKSPIYTPALSNSAHLMLGCSRRIKLLDMKELYRLTIGLAQAAQHLADAFRNNSICPESWCHQPATPSHYRLGC